MLLLFVARPCAWLFLDEDEPRYAAASRTMLDSRDAIVPRFNGEPRYQKPPLTYWLMAGSMAVLGENERAARLPSALATAGTALALFAFAWRAGGRRAAWFAAAVYCSAPFVGIWACAASTDAILAFLLTCTMLLVSVAMDSEPRVKRLYYVLAAGLSALSVLTKGPLGVVVPLAGWLIALAVRREARAELRAFPWVRATLVFLAIAAPWFVAIYLIDGGAFFRVFFLWEHLRRVAGGIGGPKEWTGTFLANLIVPVAAAVGFAPWTAFAVRGLLARFAPTGASDRAVRVQTFARVWLWVVLVLFTVSRGQWPSYALPAMAPAALLAALELEGIAALPRADRRSRTLIVALILCALWAVVLVAIPFAAGRAPGDYRESVPVSALAGPLTATAGGLVVGGIVLAAFWRRRTVVAVVVAASALALSWAYFTVVPFATAVEHLTRPQLEAGRVIREQPEGTVTLTYGPRYSSLVYYAERPIRLYRRQDPAFHWVLLASRALGRDCVVVTDRAGGDELSAAYGAETIADRGRLLVCRVRGGQGAGSFGGTDYRANNDPRLEEAVHAPSK